MLADITVMVWKEWKGYVRFQSGSRPGITGLLIMIAIFGILMPIQAGRTWVETAVPLSLWAVVPLILIGAIVADSFAGERERHTLETLLVSRLSDQAILLGKICAVVSYVWLITQMVFIAALIPINILYGKGEFLFYSSEVALSGLILSLLLSSLMSNIGVLVSLRAGSVRQAQQTLGLSIFIFAYGIPMAVIYAIRFVPEQTRNALLQPILSGNIGLFLLAGSALLIILNIGLFAATMARFQRNRLILD